MSQCPFQRPNEPDGMSVVDRLLRTHGRIAPDEIWVHGMWTPDKWLRCLKAKLSGKKLVRMTHGALSPVYLREQSPLKKRLVRPLERFLFSLADRVVVTTPAEADWFRLWWGKPVNSDFPIELLDLKRFFTFDLTACAAKRDSLAMLDRPLHVLYLGRRHPLKGIDCLEAAVERIPETELRIVTDHCGEALEADWAWCDVLCLPTLSENFGLVVAEALARGKPAVTTDGAPAWDGQDGVIYLRGYRDATPATRVNLLTEALRALLESGKGRTAGSPAAS